MIKCNFLRSGLLMCAALYVFTGVAHAQFKKAEAIMDVPGKKPVMVEVNNTGSTELFFNYKIPDAELVSLQEKYDGETVKRLYLGNAPLMGDEGKPVLPVIPSQFIIPAGKTIASIDIQRTKKTVLGGKHFVEFGKAKIPLLKDARFKKTLPSATIYQKDAAYPSESGVMVNVQSKRGVKIAFVNLNPVEYFPKSGKITVYSEIELKVTLKDEKKAYLPNKIKVRKNGLDPQKMGIENPDALDTYENGVGPLLNKTTGGICATGEYSYVLITSQTILDAKTDVTVHDLIKQRQAQGLTATIVTIEDILSSYSGIDDAEKLRNFIIDAYAVWNTEYVVLGGDVSIVPYRNLYSDGEFIPSDLYFQCLDGSFNDDGDLYWGEPNDGPGGSDVDLMSEISIGRISAETPEEMSHFIYKTLTYENLPAATPYLTRACILGEYLGEQFGPEEFGYATPYMEEIRLGSAASGYTTQGFTSCMTFAPDTVYDRPDFSWSTDSILKVINSGSYSIINHLGHANEQYVMKFTNADADKFTNKLPLFAYSQGCYPGYFPVDCIAEHLTTSTRSGLFAGVFNTVYGYGAYNDSKETLDGPSQRFNRQFWDAFFNEYIRNIGDINADSHEDNIWCIQHELIRYVMYETQLFGDPATMLRGLIQGPSLIYNEQSVNDNGSGNNDGICNPGETVDLTVTVQNIGDEASKEATCVLSSGDQYVSVQSAESLIPPINCCGAVASVMSAFQISIRSDCPTPYVTDLKLTIKDGDSTWALNIPVEVHRSGIIAGTVLINSDEMPLPGAHVSYTGPMSGQITTGADGSYSCQLIEGTYSVWVNANGYLPSDTFMVSIPPSAELNVRMYRPQLSVDPESIDRDIKVDDSLKVNVNIENTGDAVLQVSVNDRQISKPYTQKNPLRIKGEKATSSSKYNNNVKPIKTIIPKKYQPGKSLDISSKVLYLNTIVSDSGSDYFVDGLKAIPAITSLDVINGGYSTPNLDYLMQYDCVILSASDSWSDPVLLGDVLADYVDNGRMVILMVATFALGGDYQIQGRIAEPDYLPLVPGSGLFTECIASDFIQHQITAGVTSIISAGHIETSAIQGNGIALGLYDCNSSIVGAYNPQLPVVAINVLPFDGYWGGDLIQMISNCIEWKEDQKWLQVVPESAVFSIFPGASKSITAQLNSLMLIGGLYTGEISLVHNDPSIPGPFVIPVTMTVDGFRSLEAEPGSVAFDEVWLGNSDTALVTLVNSGSEATTVNSIKPDSTAFIVPVTLPLIIKARKSVQVPVIFKPGKIGNAIAIMTIKSNAEDNSTIKVALSGYATKGPNAVVDPEKVHFSFQPKDTPADRTFVLSNTGAAVLDYTIRIRQNNKSLYFKNHNASLIVRKGMIYDRRNYSNPFVQGTVLVGLKKNANNFSSTNILMEAGVESVVELAKGINPVTKIKSFTTRKLLKVKLFSNSNDAVLDAIRRLSKDPNVEYAEPDYIVKAVNTPNDEYFSSLYAMNNSGQTGGSADADIDATEAWDSFTGSSDEIIIGVIDTGIDYLHPDLVDNIWKNPGEIPGNGVDDDGNGYIDDYYGWDFGSDDNDPMDVHGHGTHCSGTIAAKGNNGIGVAGVMWDARVMALKFLDDSGSGATSDAIDAINYATMMNVSVTSNSWGGGGYSQALEEVIAASGIFVAAAGNYGTDNDSSPFYPASHDIDNIIAVAATDHNDQLATFSCFGNRSVDLGAPGVDIMSTVPGEGYSDGSGTSMAAPHVTGAVGLLWSKNPALTSLEVKNAILQSVDTIAALAGKTVSGGRLNLQKLLTLAGDSWITITPNGSGTLNPSGSQEFTITANPEKLAAGTWNAEINFITNDPFHRNVVVQVAADVAGCKSIAALHEPVDFGQIWENRDTVVNIALINECNDSVIVSGCDFGNDAYTIDRKLPFVIRPFGQFEMPVRFSPQTAGDYPTTVVITSDAEDNPSLSVNVNGLSVTPPEISIDPGYFNKSLAFGVIDTEVTLLSNTGGADYHFKTSTRIRQEKSLGTIGDATLYAVAERRNLIFKVDPNTGEPIDSIDVSSVNWISALAFDGEYLYLAAEGNTIVILDPEEKKVIRTIPIGNIYIGSLGITRNYVVFEDFHSNLVYVVDKKSENVINQWYAESYTDMTCSDERNSVFMVNWSSQIEERHIVTGELINSYPINNDNYYYSLGYSGTSKLLFASDWNGKLFALDPDNGTVVKEYQNALRYNLITADEVAVGPKWLSTVPGQGSIAAGEELPLDVLFNSNRLVPGLYQAEVVLSHTPGILPDIIIPCTLSVSGEKRLRVQPGSLSFKEIWKGRGDSAIVYLVNDGNEATTVSSIYSNNTVFSTAYNETSTIEPFDSIPITIRCFPTKVGTVNGTIAITSNAEDNPAISIRVSAVTVNPPKITVTPSTLSAEMLPDRQADYSIVLKNSGGADYPFKVTVLSNETSNPNSGALYAIQSTSLVTVDPVDGFITDTILDYPDVNSMAYDGKHIYLGSYYNGLIIVVDPVGKQVIDSIFTSFSSIRGLAVTEDKLIVSDYSTIYIIDKFTGITISSWNLEISTPDFTYCSPKNTLFLYNYKSGRIEERAITDGSIINSFDFTGKCAGLAYSSSSNILMVSMYYSIEVLNPQSGELLGSIPVDQISYITFDEVSSNTWIKSLKQSGVVPKKGSTAVGIRLNSSNMLPDIYTAWIILEHDQKWAPGPFIVECELLVKSQKLLVVNQKNLNFGSVAIGGSKSIPIELINAGNDTTTIKRLSSSSRKFRFESVAPVKVPPSSTVIVNAMYSPTNKGWDAALLTMKTDADNVTNVILDARGAGIIPTMITIGPKSISATAKPRDRKIMPITFK